MPLTACQGATDSGQPCATKPIEGTDFCPWHSGDEARRQFASHLGKISQVKMAEKRAKQAAAQPTRMPLRTLDEILDFLERETCHGDAQRSSAAARVARAAQDLLPFAALIEENKQLRKLLAELNPAALKAI